MDRIVTYYFLLSNITESDRNGLYNFFYYNFNFLSDSSRDRNNSIKNDRKKYVLYRNTFITLLPY